MAVQRPVAEAAPHYGFQILLDELPGSISLTMAEVGPDQCVSCHGRFALDTKRFRDVVYRTAKGVAQHH